jgi:membrane protein
MFSYFESTLTWSELAKRTYRELMEDDAMGLAAQLAYYFFLALFPAILCVLALVSFLPLQNFTDAVVRSAAAIAPEPMLVLIREQMARLAEGNHGGIAIVGLLGALWSSSAALVAVIDAINRAYDIEEGRPFWKVRLTAIALTVGLAVFVVLAFGLVVAGPQVADWLAGKFALGDFFTWGWKILQWPVAFALMTTGIGLIYYFAPDAEQDWVWITPGSLLATVLWLVGSIAFRLYVVNFGSYEATYGTVTGVILLLLWFYLSAFVIILGAEVSAEIEHASPWGKEPAEKVPGQKKKIGAAAGRAFREKGQSPRAPVIAPQPRVAVFSPKPSMLERVGVVLLLIANWRSDTKSKN